MNTNKPIGGRCGKRRNTDVVSGIGCWANKISKHDLKAMARGRIFRKILINEEEWLVNLNENLKNVKV